MAVPMAPRELWNSIIIGVVVEEGDWGVYVKTSVGQYIVGSPGFVVLYCPCCIMVIWRLRKLEAWPIMGPST